MQHKHSSAKFLISESIRQLNCCCASFVYKGIMTAPRSVFLLISALSLCSALLSAQQPSTDASAPTAADIMARVASNQDQAESERVHYVYLRHAKITSRKGKTIQCEEITDSRITPSAGQSNQQLLKLEGRYLKNGKYILYKEPLPGNANKESTDDDGFSLSIGDDDRSLVESMSANLSNSKTKDGIGSHLFPLTSKNQGDYAFHLIGTEHLNNHEVFHIEFRPKDKNEFDWKGDAYIDTTAYQPVMVSTSMSRKLPFAVRTLLGTSFPGLGFTVICAPQPDGTWFPVSFSTEFKIKVLFLYHREILIDSRNSNFEKTHSDSTIISSVEPKPAPQP